MLAVSQWKTSRTLKTVLNRTRVCRTRVSRRLGIALFYRISLRSSTDAKNVWNSAFTPPFVFMMCLNKGGKRTYEEKINLQYFQNCLLTACVLHLPAYLSTYLFYSVCWFTILNE
jgi:hypothetical protein